jgi:diketogulonate reductase-like aldo/keto reductase
MPRTATNGRVVVGRNSSSRRKTTTALCTTLLSLYLLLDRCAALALYVDRRDVLTQAWSTTGAALLPSSFWLAREEQQPAATAPTSNTIQPTVLLDGNIAFPLVSFGLQIYDDDTAYRLTSTALQVGYRNFFASVLAGNQRGFAKAVRDSRIERSELFICGSVVSNRATGYEAARAATTRGGLQNMDAFAVGNIDYLDQIMLDYPGPDSASIRGQWQAFAEMADQKLTRTLAVSNFDAKQLDAILLDDDHGNTTTTRRKPLVNQLPYGVAYHPPNVLEYNAQRHVLVQAWAPLGGSLGGRFTPALKAQCAAIGAPYGKSAYQVALRWIIQNGGAVCTQSKKREHFVKDLNLFDFALTAAEMDQLAKLA